MIDPIGLAGTASGLLSLTIQLAQTTSNILTTLRTAPKQWSELVITLRDLTPILQKLAKLPDDDTDYDCLERPLSTLRKHLLYLQKRLVEIRRTKKWRFRLKWLMKKEEVEGIVAALERAKEVLVFAMQELQLFVYPPCSILSMILMFGLRETTMNLHTTVGDTTASLVNQLETMGFKLEMGHHSLHGRLHRLGFTVETGHRSIEIQLQQIVRRLKADNSAHAHTGDGHMDRRLRMLLVKELGTHNRRRARVHNRIQSLTTQKDLHIIGTIAEEEFRLVIRKAAGAAAPLAFVLCVIFF
jgi:hypothetical protein